MRKLLIIALIFICSKGYSLNYYFSNSGNDSYSSVQAQNPNTPWATLTKLNSFFTSLNAGDSVLFKRGDTFYGSITCRKSGSAGASIIFGAYGSGAKPILTGFTSISSWSSIGGNLYTTTLSVPVLNMVTINSNFQAMGRYPKLTDTWGGYDTINSTSSATQITSNAISGYPSFVNGEVVIRKQHWVLDRETVLTQAGTSITFTQNNTGYTAQSGWGFFFQNSPNACTLQGEWSYNGTTLTMYSSTGTPSGVKAATVDSMIYIGNNSYLSFNNINFTGVNYNVFTPVNGNNISITSCDFSFIGVDVFDSRNGFSNNFTFLNNTSNYVMSNVLDLHFSTNCNIQYNTLLNTGVVAGMGYSEDGSYAAMEFVGNSSTVSHNYIKYVGYIGINWEGTNSTISYNYVDSTGYIKDDNGGIYCDARNLSGSVVSNNIVLNSPGCPQGTGNNLSLGEGIYVDDAAYNVTITNNTVANCSDASYFIHSGHELTYRNNTSYNSLNAIRIYNDQNAAANLSFKNNIFFAKTASQLVLATSGGSSAPSTWFTSTDSNYYCRPIADNTVFSVSGLKTLAQWQSYSSQDAHSKKTPKTITDTSQLVFAYNATNSPAITILNAVYIDVYGTAYNGSITLQPYTSAVLIYSTASTLPLSASATNTSISCNGGTSTVTASANGGSAPYTYSIDGGSYQSSVTFNSIVAGTHTITAKDAVNTLANYGLNISEPTAISGYVETTTAPATVTTTASGGTGTLTYKIDAGSYQSSNIFTGVAAGNHTITVKDANACTFPISFTVIAAGVPLAISASSTDPDCYGGNGSVTIGASGGMSPYTGTGVFAQAAGTVTYTVTDNVGAQKDTTITITQPTQVSIIQIITNNILVYGGTDTAFVSATGGTGTLTYQIDGGGYQASDTFPTVSAGNHTIDVKDANDCVNSQGFTMLSVPAPPPSSNYILRRKGRIHRYVNQ